MHFDWLKLITWLLTSNHNALFKSRVDRKGISICYPSNTWQAFYHYFRRTFHAKDCVKLASWWACLISLQNLVVITYPRSSLVAGDEGCIGPSGKLNGLCQTPKNYAAHAWHYSTHVWLLGQSSCSSPSTKDIHDLHMENDKLLEMVQPQPLFVYFSSFQQQFYRKIVDFSGNRTRIVGVEDEHSDH